MMAKVRGAVLAFLFSQLLNNQRKFNKMLEHQHAQEMMQAERFEHLMIGYANLVKAVGFTDMQAGEGLQVMFRAIDEHLFGGTN
jgi:hypothetical protein